MRQLYEFQSYMAAKSAKANGKDMLLTGMAMKASNSRTGYSVQLTFPAGDDQLTLLISLQQALDQLRRCKA